MYWFYKTETGLFTGDSYLGPDILGNTPHGCSAMKGVLDWRAQRVDVNSGTVIDWQPPAPADDELRSWSWSESARRWVPLATLEANRRARIAQVQSAIEASEAAQARPVREVLEAMLAGRQAADAPKTRLEAISAEIALLQGVRQALETATTQGELDAVVWPAISKGKP